MWFDPDAGHWLITTDMHLPMHAVKSAAAWCKKLQIQRATACGPGDKRELIQRSIVALDQMSIKQNLVNPTTKTGRGDLSLFEGKK